MKNQKTKTTTVDPSVLAPDFDNIPGELVAEEYPFWLGVTADCPRGQIDVAGLHFPKKEEDIILNDAGKQVRVPQHGALNFTVTKHHFEELVRLLSRLVIRPHKVIDADGTGENIGDPVQNSKGRLIKIPDDKMLAGASESGRKLKPYVKQPGDRPATEFMYFIYAPDKVRGNKYQTIAEIGLEWPGTLDEEVVEEPKPSIPKEPKPLPMT
tara:strand:+ start:3998 stop:4630 length:633 start_codon:yes stop_codon:yes gene_type:complete